MDLTDLGFDARQETIYRALLRNPAADIEQLAAELQLDREAVAQAGAELVELGVLKRDRSGSGFIVPRPAAAIGQLIERREEELLRLYRRASESRFVIDELESLYYSEPEQLDPTDQGVERLTGLDAIRDRLEELSFFTRTSVFSIQPGGPQSREALEAARPLDQRGIRRGVEMRVIYEASLLDDELNRAYLRDLVMGGAKVRVTRQQLERMVIMDSEVAMVPVDPANTRRGALIVRNPGLVAGFLDLFQRAWQDAEELPWQTEGVEQQPPADTISPQDKKILELLASGCTDETSAREVGVSVRHLRRAISRLMQELGANSRFEAGVEAARRGWL
jgi:DNA-binding CsgD family transcriptional regulator/sugar-specific transcriptional regulator TrmB